MASVSGVAMILNFLIMYCRSECLSQLKTPQSFSLMAKNRALPNPSYQVKHVPSAVICGRDCSMNPQCASFNYQASSHLCELNNQTRIQSQCAFVEKQGSVYFENYYDALFFPTPHAEKNTSCLTLQRAGHLLNGLYTIYPCGMAEGLQVYCDMETVGGGWIVFQRRQDGSVDFYRNWADYQSGFGNLSGEFWLGNDALRILTETGQWQLRVDLADWEGNTAWAEYGEFSIAGQKYTLHVGSYNAESTARNSLTNHDTYNFTTWDQDNDVDATFNCGHKHKSGWWFKACFTSNLNGQYQYTQPTSGYLGIQWKSWKYFNTYSLKLSTMKIREVN